MFIEHKISATMRERKELGFPLFLKSLDEQGRFAGYASVFDHVDNQRDRVVSGAFYKTLQGRVSSIKLLWQHQQSEPIGIFERIFEDDIGLYVEGRLLLSVQRAKEAYELLKEGAVSGLSIGYSPVRYQIDPESGIRTLLEVDLWEISLVTFPANSAAQVTVVKSKPSSVSYEEGADYNASIRCGHFIALSNSIDRAILALQP
ncbi:MAG: HK97 family phage prohead protease [Rickettsiales bacterium]|jgi:HK97 family phage prohead protease|nr:HK97 family phage prohead protease [Rickettsiales bacterium]